MYVDLAYTVSQKRECQSVYFCAAYSHRPSKTFTLESSNKFVILVIKDLRPIYIDLSHLKRVATLLCEMSSVLKAKWKTRQLM